MWIFKEFNDLLLKLSANPSDQLNATEEQIFIRINNWLVKKINSINSNNWWVYQVFNHRRSNQGTRIANSPIINMQQLAIGFFYDDFCDSEIWFAAENDVNEAMYAWLHSYIEQGHSQESFGAYLLTLSGNTFSSHPAINISINNYVDFLCNPKRYLISIQDSENIPLIIQLMQHLEKFLSGIGMDNLLNRAVIPAYTEEVTNSGSVSQYKICQAKKPDNGFDNFLEMFGLSVRARAKQIAIVEKNDSLDSELTYAQLDKITDALAAQILSQLSTVTSAQTPHRIGAYTPHSSLAVISLLAIWKAGCIYVPLSQDESMTSARLLDIAADCKLSMVLSHQSCSENYFIGAFKSEFPAADIIYIDQQALLKTVLPKNFSAKIIPADQLAYIIYSSGTTGEPKGIAIKHGGLIEPVLAHHRIFNIQAETRFGLYADVSGDPFLLQVMMTLGMNKRLDHPGGGTLYIVPAEIRRDPKTLGEFYEKHAITVAIFTPTMLALLDPQRFKKLKYIQSMGEKLPENVIKKWVSNEESNLTFIDGYGPTEVSICTSVGECDAKSWSAGEIIPGLRGFILSPDLDKQLGKKLTDDDIKSKQAENTILIFNEQDEEQEGELFLQGFGVGRYWGEHQQENNNLRFYEKMYIRHKDGRVICYENIYRTGDLVKRDREGRLTILGRIDNELKLKGGIRVEFRGYERKLNQHSNVDNVQIGSLDNEFAVAVIKTKKDLDEKETKKLAEELLDLLDKSTPIRLLINPRITIAKSASGKQDLSGIIKLNVTQLYPAIKNDKDKTEMSETEKLVAGIWYQVLFRNSELDIKETDLNRYMSLLALGGSSFHAMQIVNRLNENEKIVKKLAVTDLKHYPTIAALARYIDNHSYDDVIKTIQEGKPDQQVPLFFIPSLTGDGEKDYLTGKVQVDKLWKSGGGNTSTPIYTFITGGIKNELRAESVEEIARQYVNAMKNRFTTECVLVGFSFGCKIAYEMANLLKLENIGFAVKIILIDGPTSVYEQRMTENDYGHYLEKLGDGFAKQIGVLVGIDVSVDYEKLREKAKSSQIQAIFDQLLDHPDANDDDKRKALMVMRANALATFNHHPTVCHQDVLLITCEATQRLLGSDNLGWPLLSEAQVISLKDVNHFSILEASIKIIKAHYDIACQEFQKTKPYRLKTILVELSKLGTIAGVIAMFFFLAKYQSSISQTEMGKEAIRAAKEHLHNLSDVKNNQLTPGQSAWQAASNTALKSAAWVYAVDVITNAGIPVNAAIWGVISGCVAGVKSYKDAVAQFFLTENKLAEAAANLAMVEGKKDILEQAQKLNLLICKNVAAATAATAVSGIGLQRMLPDSVNTAPISRVLIQTTGQSKGKANTNLLGAQQVETDSTQQTNHLPNGLEYHAIPRDGHCLYNAVALYIGQEQSFLRQRVATYLENHQNEFSDFIILSEGQTLTDYLNAVRSSTEWATHIEIEVLMRVLGRPIIIIDPQGTVRNREDAQERDGEPIFVYYNGYNHYDGALLSSDYQGRSRELLNQLLTQSNIPHFSM